jgi:tetratricopeptide (TPR) repeat protein
MRNRHYIFIITAIGVSIAALPLLALPQWLTGNQMKQLNSLKPHDRLEQLKQLADSVKAEKHYASLYLYEWVAQLADSLGKYPAQMDALNEIASLHAQQDDYEKAQQNLQKAITLADKQSGLDTLLIDSYMLLGILFERTKKYDDALEYYNRAGDLQERLKAGPQEKARLLTNIAHVYDEQGLYFKSVNIYKEALQICKTHKILFGEALISQNLANAYNELGKYAESIAYSNQSLMLATANRFNRIEVGSYQNLGAAYLKLQQYPKAIEYYEKALQLAKAVGYTKAMLNSALQLSEAYEKQGNTLKAFEFYKMHTQWKDSVFSQEKSEKIEALQAAFKSREKEAAIKELERQNELAAIKQRQLYALLFFLVLIAGLGAYLLYYRQRKARQLMQQQQQLEKLEKQQELQKLEKDKMQYELNALKAQMNPHFLFNALNSIQELFMTGESRLGNEYLGRFSDLTRAILNASGKATISLREEMDMLHDYLNLEALRFSENFEYELKAAENLPIDDIEIPPLLVQPYVENAIKHGLMHKTGHRILKVIFEQPRQGYLRVTVYDNGIGRARAGYYAALKNKQHKSFATGATQKRLELLNHGLPHSITVQYNDLEHEGEPAGTEVILQIPIEDE